MLLRRINLSANNLRRQNDMARQSLVVSYHFK